MSITEQLKYSTTQSKKFYLYYLLFLTVFSIALTYLTFIFNWSDVFYWLGGIGIVAGFLSIISSFMAGFVTEKACPRCNHKINIMHPKHTQIKACDKCDTWLEFSEKSTKIITDDYIADYPAFITEYPKSDIVWPNGCPVCKKPTTRQIKITAVDDLGVAVIATVGIYNIYSTNVPACDLHDNGVGLFVGVGKTQAVGFRNLAYMKEFEALNKKI